MDGLISCEHGGGFAGGKSLWIRSPGSGTDDGAQSPLGLLLGRAAAKQMVKQGAARL